MSSTCAVQGVVKLKRKYFDEIQAVYQTPDQGFNSDKEDISRYLFGVNVSENIQTHFSEKAANGSFDDANFETGYLTFVSGFSSYLLDEFIEKVNLISDHFILYTVYENQVQLRNEQVVIKNLNELKQYLSKFNSPHFIESEIPFDKFEKDGIYLCVEKDDCDSSFRCKKTTEHVWEFQEGY